MVRSASRILIGALLAAALAALAGVAEAQQPASPAPAPRAPAPPATGGAVTAGERPVAVAGSAELAACLADRRRARETRRLPRDSAVGTCVDDLRRAGFLELAIDSVADDGDTIRVWAHEGQRYRIGSWTATVNPDSTYGPTAAEDSLARPRDLDDADARARDYLQEHLQSGYPFARVRLGAGAPAGDSVDLSAVTWSGPLVTYGGVRFEDGVTPPVAPAFLDRFLRLERGRRYRQSEIDDIARRLRGLSYLELAREPLIVFEGPEAVVYLDARPRRTSRFDFLLGFLPNSANNDGQLLLTGDATLDLDNALRRGERLRVDFERLQPQSSEIELAASYPYLFGSPFGARVDFGLYRQQEDWLRVNYEAGLSYAFGGGDAYELYYEGGVVQALSFDTLRVATTGRLPDALDTRRDGFGVRLRLDRRDAALDTRRGTRLVVDAAASLREVSVDRAIRDLGEGLARQADSIGGRTAQYRLRGDLEGYLPVGRRAVAYGRLRGGSLFGVQRPLRNELFRIGGQALLRGFDEQAIDAQTYAVASAELRLLLGGGSFLFVFGDQGLLDDPYRAGGRRDAPTGFGAGLRLATGNGALGLTYAYGRRSGAPVDWERAKIHVGFESRF